MARPLLLLVLTACSAAAPVQEVQQAKPAPVIDASVPKGLTVIAFDPGRFAGITRLQAEGGCSQTHVGTSSSTGVEMTFEPRGTVTACRAMSHHEVYVSVSQLASGRLTSDASNIDHGEQQGFRGRFTPRGAWLDVSLSADDSVCTHERSGMPATDVRDWTLECLSVTLAGVTAPALLCRSHGESGMADYAVGGLVDGRDERWLAVAKADGVEVRGAEQWYVAFERWKAETSDAPATLLRGEPSRWLHQ